MEAWDTLLYRFSESNFIHKFLDFQGEKSLTLTIHVTCLPVYESNKISSLIWFHKIDVMTGAIILFDSLRPSQQFFSYVEMCLPGFEPVISKHKCVLLKDTTQ